MYVIFEDGARQYRVSEGEIVEVDYRPVEPGHEVEFDRILLVQTGSGTQIGQPYVTGAKVVAEVLEHPSVKYVIQKFRRRKNYRRKKGHQQHFTRLRIRSILTGEAGA